MVSRDVSRDVSDGFSLREELVKVLFAHSALSQDTSWEELSPAGRDPFYRIVADMQPWIIEWASIIVTQSVDAAFTEGVVQGWAGNLPDTIPSEEDK